MSTEKIHQENIQSIAWRFSLIYVGMLVVSFIFLYVLFQEGIVHAVLKWDSPEYSHAYLIPVISLFIIWQKNSEITRDKFSGSWFGVVLLLLGLFFWFLGEVSTLYVIIKYV